MESQKDYKGLKFAGKPAYVISGLSCLLTCLPLGLLAMWLIDKKLPTSNRTSGTKWKIWLASGFFVQFALVLLAAVSETPAEKVAKNTIENTVETVVEDKRKCDDIEEDLVTSLDGAIGASIQIQTLSVVALEAAQDDSPSQAQVDQTIQSINKENYRVNSYATKIATLSQEYGDSCADSRREAFTAENITPRNEKLLALAGEVEEIAGKVTQLEAEQKAKAELERITPEQRAAFKALTKYNLVEEASLPEVRSQAEKFKPSAETIDLGARTHNDNDFGEDPILVALAEEAKAEVVRMDNDVRASKVEKFLANGTTISAKSNYDMIKQLEPDHPAVARFAQAFEPKPEPVAKEEPKPAAPAYKSASVALREICQAGVEYSQDGIGTPTQIAHELGYWVIDLHKQTGGKASEAALRQAGSDGYMFENCSKY